MTVAWRHLDWTVEQSSQLKKVSKESALLISGRQQQGKQHCRLE
jgi:hypothetical protein